MGGGGIDKKVDKFTYVWAIHSLIRVFELWVIILVGQIEQIVGERNKPHTKLSWKTLSKKSRGIYILDGGG